MDVDVVISAIGQKPRTDWYTPDLEERGLKLTRWNTIETDDHTLQSAIPHIFSGGDIWSGPASTRRCRRHRDAGPRGRSTST